MLSIMAYVQIYENNDANVIEDKIEHVIFKIVCLKGRSCA